MPQTSRLPSTKGYTSLLSGCSTMLRLSCRSHNRHYSPAGGGPEHVQVLAGSILYNCNGRSRGRYLRDICIGHIQSLRREAPLDHTRQGGYGDYQCHYICDVGRGPKYILFYCQQHFTPSSCPPIALPEILKVVFWAPGKPSVIIGPGAEEQQSGFRLFHC